jgi:hypothetical protein
MRKFKNSSDSITKPILKNLENIDEMDDFLDSYHLPKLNQKQVNYLNNPTINGVVFIFLDIISNMCCHLSF